ncbi:GNAT family N-acetyltransferase [Hazenella coriacea]|uniref:GNAT family acetyltransferase n=1 Tax=Hazenella coriacea TaxID=1179467 RepID=A0A4R3L845_9BACL|nr:GNAT family N-acetyltransferase [Hazenella coriacea]TCS93676.1 GNAT family acetyltransferase [Hazenella coriacea]
MVKLVPMTEQDFLAYEEKSIQTYAENKIKAGNWSKETAMELSQESFRNLLPQQTQTPGQYLFNIMSDQEEVVGHLWFAVKKDTAFLYHILIFEEFQGRGFGKQAMAALEEKVKEFQVTKISLHAFGFNERAISLYKKIGYEITNVNMSKSL